MNLYSFLLNIMKAIYIELTSRCNLSCIMCYRNTWENVLGDMSKEIIDNISAHIPKSVKKIVFGGIGEPTVAKNFDYAVEKFKDYNLEITTNGVITNKTIKTLCTHFKKIIISVDGTEEDYYNVRKTEFSHIRETLTYIAKCKKEKGTKIPSIEFAFVLTRSNQESIFKVLDFAKEFNADKILVSHLLPINDDQKKEIFYTLDYNQEGHDWIDRVYRYAHYGVGVRIVFPYMEIKTERLCFFIENDYTYIDYTGEVIPCYRFANTYKEIVFDNEKTVLKHSFGSILESNINDIYYNEEYTNFRKDVKNTKHPSCIDCDFREGCDFILDTEFDCYSYSPSCADCLWNRNIIKCT